MLYNNTKALEENSISLLKMRKQHDQESPDDLKESLKELLLYENTMLSDVTLNRLVRRITNYIEDASIDRIHADEILLLTLSQIGMDDLVDEYKTLINGK